MLTAEQEQQLFLETAQALLERQDPDEILAKLASVLAEQGRFPLVSLSLYDRPHPLELVENATFSRKVSLEMALGGSGHNDKAKRQRRDEKIELPFLFKDKALGLTELYLSQGRAPTESELDYYQALINVASLAIHQANQRLQLEELSIKDDLTGCYNRRYFFESLRREVSWAERYGRVFSLLLMDLDNLKQVNDVHGHLAGDTVLRTLGELVRENVRTSDLVCRYGGDEFVILLPETDKTQARMLAQRLLKKIERKSLRVGRRRIRISACYGVSAFPEDENLIEAADQACYQAKAEKKSTGHTKTLNQLAQEAP